MKRQRYKTSQSPLRRLIALGLQPIQLNTRWLTCDGTHAFITRVNRFDGSATGYLQYTNEHGAADVMWLSWDRKGRVDGCHWVHRHNLYEPAPEQEHRQ